MKTLALIASIALIALALTVVVGFRFLTANANAGQRPCPQGSATFQPSAVHLGPSLVEHQSWIGVDPDQVTGGRFVFACSDGSALGWTDVRQMTIDPQTGLLELKIPTRWVDISWATGKLDGYRDPARWTVVVAASDR